METTTPTPAQAAPPAAAKPRYKKKGPVRTEAILPFAALAALAFIFVKFFFDGQLRRAIEWVGTQANGAEVNVGSLRTSFLGASITIGGIQVTDAREPSKNRVQIGGTHLGLLWDALLRAKVVAENASITNIELGTPRSSPGYVVPPSGDSAASKYIQKYKSELSRAVLAEAGELLEGLDPTKKLKDLENLKSAAKVRALKEDLARKEAEWTAAVNSLPGDKELEDLKARISKIQGGGSAAEIPGKVAEVQSLIKETEARVGAVTAQADKLAKDVQGFGGEIGKVDELAKADREDLEKQLKIPDLDAKSLSRQLFAGPVLDQVAEAERYKNMARQYLPEKKEKPVPAAPPERVRARGRNYQFGTPTSYPRFWLKKGLISSKGEHSAFGGDVTGELLDVSSEPRQLGRPAQLHLKGDFPKRQILGIDARVVVDHTTDQPSESLTAKVASYPVPTTTLSESEGLRFAFTQALGAAGIEAMIQQERLSLAIETSLREVSYDIKAKSKILEETLQAVVKNLPAVNVRAAVTGTFSDPDISIQSNLATAIQQGLAKQLQAKLAEARAKIDALIQGKISAGKAEVQGRFNAAKTKVTSQVDEKKKKVEAVKAQAMAKLDSVKSQASSVQKKAGDLLKKKLPFGR
jgi:uncharacterized protein (TIGR03545 family)